MPVAIEQMAIAPVTRVLAVNGRIAALHSVNLRLLVGGTLSHVAVSEGEQVHAGQALLRMDTAAQDAVLRQAVAALDAALVVQEQADAAYARSLVLGANVSAVALAADRRAAQSAMQEVVRMTALLEQAQVQLAHYTLRAPFAGTVVGMDAEIGQVADTGTILLTLADLETLIVETNVDETYASQIVIGQSAVLRLAGENVGEWAHVAPIRHEWHGGSFRQCMEPRTVRRLDHSQSPGRWRVFSRSSPCRPHVYRRDRNPGSGRCLRQIRD